MRSIHNGPLNEIGGCCMYNNIISNRIIPILYCLYTDGDEGFPGHIHFPDSHINHNT